MISYYRIESDEMIGGYHVKRAMDDFFKGIGKDNVRMKIDEIFEHDFRKLSGRCPLEKKHENSDMFSAT